MGECQQHRDWATATGASAPTIPSAAPRSPRSSGVTLVLPVRKPDRILPTRQNISRYASAAVDWARANGVVNGTTGNRFDPNGNATRAQVATILRNYLTMTPVTPQPDPSTGSKILVAYFSGSGNTERVAQDIADELGTDIFEITPVTPYTSADLDWTTSGSRVNREHDNEALRDIALTQTTPANWDEYDTVFIGYPIWWALQRGLSTTS